MKNISGCCFLFADNSLFITNQNKYIFKFNNVQASNLFKESALISGCHDGDVPSQVFQGSLNRSSQIKHRKYILSHAEWEHYPLVQHDQTQQSHRQNKCVNRDFAGTTGCFEHFTVHNIFPREHAKTCVSQCRKAFRGGLLLLSRLSVKHVFTGLSNAMRDVTVRLFHREGYFSSPEVWSSTKSGFILTNWNAWERKAN